MKFGKSSKGERFAKSVCKRLVAVSAACMAGAIFAVSAQNNDEALVRDIPQGISDVQALGVVKNAFQGRGWTIAGSDAKTVTAVLENGLFDSKITVYLDHENLRYRDDTTQRIVDPHSVNAAKGRIPARAPDRWLDNLKKDIVHQLTAASIAGQQARVSPEDSITRLQALKKMLDGNLITQQDYDEKKADILKGL